MQVVERAHPETGQIEVIAPLASALWSGASHEIRVRYDNIDAYAGFYQSLDTVWDGPGLYEGVLGQDSAPTWHARGIPGWPGSGPDDLGYIDEYSSAFEVGSVAVRDQSSGPAMPGRVVAFGAPSSCDTAGFALLNGAEYGASSGWNCTRVDASGDDGRIILSEGRVGGYSTGAEHVASFEVRGRSFHAYVDASASAATRGQIANYFQASLGTGSAGSSRTVEDDWTWITDRIGDGDVQSGPRRLGPHVSVVFRRPEVQVIGTIQQQLIPEFRASTHAGFIEGQFLTPDGVSLQETEDFLYLLDSNVSIGTRVATQLDADMSFRGILAHEMVHLPQAASGRLHSSFESSSLGYELTQNYNEGLAYFLQAQMYPATIYGALLTGKKLRIKDLAENTVRWKDILSGQAGVPMHRSIVSSLLVESAFEAEQAGSLADWWWGIREMYSDEPRTLLAESELEAFHDGFSPGFWLERMRGEVPRPTMVAMDRVDTWSNTNPSVRLYQTQTMMADLDGNKIPTNTDVSVAVQCQGTDGSIPFAQCNDPDLPQPSTTFSMSSDEVQLPLSSTGSGEDGVVVRVLVAGASLIPEADLRQLPENDPAFRFHVCLTNSGVCADDQDADGSPDFEDQTMAFCVSSATFNRRDDREASWETFNGPRPARSDENCDGHPLKDMLDQPEIF